jgi:hypothetical protein
VGPPVTRPAHVSLCLRAAAAAFLPLSLPPPPATLPDADAPRRRKIERHQASEDLGEHALEQEMRQLVIVIPCLFSSSARTARPYSRSGSGDGLTAYSAVHAPPPRPYYSPRCPAGHPLRRRAGRGGEQNGRVRARDTNFQAPNKLHSPTACATSAAVDSELTCKTTAPTAAEGQHREVHHGGVDSRRREDKRAAELEAVAGAGRTRWTPLYWSHCWPRGAREHRKHQLHAGRHP